MSKLTKEGVILGKSPPGKTLLLEKARPERNERRAHLLGKQHSKQKEQHGIGKGPEMGPCFGVSMNDQCSWIMR